MNYSRNLIVFLVGLEVLGLSPSNIQAEPLAKDSAPLKHHVLYLHTEFLPYEVKVDKGIAYRLGREVIRQALLVAARDEMGWSTSDETLGETPPADAEVVELLLRERADLDGKWNLQLFAYTPEVDIHKDEPIWEKTYDYIAIGDQIYADIIPKLDADIRGEFLEALQACGLEKNPIAAEPQVEEVPADVESRLLEVDFITQFGIVRQAHQSMAEHGESPEWLGVLVRAYANLSLLTQHQWNSTTEVFSARSWHYAQRLLQSYPEYELGLWNRAYARTLGGTINFALKDLETLDAKEVDPKNLPTWTQLLQPYCEWNREALTDLGNQHQEIRAWAARLDFQIASAYRYSQWMMPAAREVAQVSPTAYGVYAELAHHGGSLGAYRTGGNYGPKAWSYYMPKSIDRIPHLPQTIRDFLPTNEEQWSTLAPLFQDPNPEDPISAAAPFLADRLRQETETGAIADLSWSALAYLLDEEQFVQVANLVTVARYGTESSTFLGKIVDSVLPLVADHRYAGFVESHRYQLRAQQKEVDSALQSIELRDPRKNMSRLFTRAWNTTYNNDEQLGRRWKYQASRNFTMQGLIEYIYPTSPEWSPSDKNFGQLLAREFGIIVPGSDVALRMKVQSLQNPKPWRLKTWEKKLKVDPVAFRLLGVYANKQKDTERAKRCYRKSLDAIPNLKAARNLAKLHWRLKEFDEWENTYLDYLRGEDSVLAHARAHQELAEGYCQRGNWQKALGHANSAAQTWSGWGMLCASTVCDGLARWVESEEWIREVSVHYPSASGSNWYFWCARTGRGDRTTAKKYAEHYFSALGKRLSRGNFIRLGVFQLLHGELDAARDSYQKALAFYPSYTCAFMVAQLSRELEDEPTRKQVLQTLQAVADSRITSLPFSKTVNRVGLALLELMQTGDTSPEKLALIEEHLVNLNTNSSRSTYAYFFATELAALGLQEEAEKYWRHALVIPDHSQEYATLAGAQLSKIYETSRPDDDVLNVKDLWPQPEAEEELAKTE